MISRPAQITLRRSIARFLRALLAIAIVVLLAAMFFRWYRGIHSAEDVRSQVLLSAIGAAIGAWFADILIAGVRRHTKLARASLSALLISQILYHLMVWTSAKTHALTWRAWWVATILAFFGAHAVWLSLRASIITSIKLARFTRVFAGVTALTLALLALSPTIPPDVGTVYLILLGVLFGCTAVGSIVLRIRTKRQSPPTFATRLQKLGWIGMAQAAVFAFGFYAGRITRPPPSPMDTASAGALAHLSRAELESQLRADLNRLHIVADGLSELAGKSKALHDRLQSTMAAEHRAFYHPTEEDEIRAQFLSYLAYRAALLRLVATYAGFDAIADAQLKPRAFLVGYAAGVTVYDASLALVHGYRDEPAARRKLNEPDPACGIPAGAFDQIYAAVASERNVEAIHEMGAFYFRQRDAWRAANVLPPADFDWLDTRITRATDGIKSRAIDLGAARREQLWNRVRGDAYSPTYAVQSLVSTWIGDTRLVGRPPFIQIDQILAMRAKLKPGDIFLERRNWFASNAFLPGFWPHAALYLGTPEELATTGLIHKTADGRSWTSDDANVASRLDEYLHEAEDGQPHTVMESVSEGVIFNSLTESMHADYVAVLRPRLSEAQKALALARAFSHQGKPYDFEFDFFSADKLVCTELVYRSYEGLIHFDLVKVMGRDTLPALEICKKFAAERNRPERQLDFVLFLDAVPDRGTAREVAEEDFCHSAHRPRSFNE